MTPFEEAPDAAELIRFGSVVSVDLAGARCVVAVGDIVTPPIPWIERAMGATRSWSPPSVGEQVLLICPEGELGLAVALRGILSDAFVPVGNSAEELLRFDDGALIAYDPVAHRLRATLPAGSQVDIVADRLTITGDVGITGNVEVTGGLTTTQDVVADGKSLRSHRHLTVQPGSGQSGPPA